MTTDAASRTAWFQQLALISITVVLVLQNTKQALLPAKQTPVLWGAELAAIAGVLILRSGWLRDARWRDEQHRLGTLANNFYEPRREALVSGFAVAGGVFGALWWAAATWGVVLTGMRRGVVTRGLLDFEIAALAGAITGSIVGAVIGLVAGQVWETRHRRNRIARQVSHG
jgi:uncharacterized membrane protein YccC